MVLAFSQTQKPPRRPLEFPLTCPVSYPIESLDAVDGVVRAHVVGMIAAEHHMIAAERVDRVPADGIVVNETVDVDARQIFVGRLSAEHARFFSHGVAVTPTAD